MSPGHPDARGQARWRWLSWIAGAALAFRLSEAREFALTGLWFSRRAVGPGPDAGTTVGLEQYWSVPAADVALRLQSGPQGLASREAADRLRKYGPNSVREHHQLSRLRVLLNQVRSPLLLLLLFAAAASGITREWFDAGMVLLIVLATVAIGYSREYGAQAAAAALRARVHVRPRVLRDGEAKTVSVEEVVPGDVAFLSAGSLVPADGVLLEATDFFVSESALTGESFPVEKQLGVVDAACPLGRRTNCVFLGTNVRSGSARCVVVRTGPSTEFGAIASRLSLRPPETEFDRGIRHFGYLLSTVMLVLVIVIFAAHMINGRPAVETLLFTVALAVGLSPELLPAILSVNLARGARVMAQHGVLVRRLNAIENLGSMDVLCTDKTGTLTEGAIKVDGAYDPSGAPSREVLELAALNASLETGLDNPLDDAIVAALRPDLTAVRKVAEIPFDYVRKRVTVVIRSTDGVRLVTKGAFRQVIAVCTHMTGGAALDEPSLRSIESQYEAWGRNGIRAVAVAVRTMADQAGYTRADERDLTFVGFVTFLDQPKEGVRETLTALARLGVAVKLITGDSGPVSRHVATLVGMRADRVLTGAELDRLHDEALWHAAAQTELFVEVDPRQKERIIVALKKIGHVVGFLGDGVNDAPAMHAADTSLSVERAVDVAREAADFVLLERSLDVIRRGIEEGRKTFANTLKYVLITTSANLGNMVSMAVASLFMPFLPLLAGQILLNNFLSDIPAVGLADDSVDREEVDQPRRWNMRFIGSFMIVFGLVSALFDFLTFGVLRFVFDAGAGLFRTAWFAESLLTELVIALVIRTRRPFYRSRPGTLLLASTVVLVVVTFGLVVTPVTTLFGFVPLSAPVLLVIAGISLLYVGAVELAKQAFYGRSGTSIRE
jgi:Mg2+-importing ATPase